MAEILTNLNDSEGTIEVDRHTGTPKNTGTWGLIKQVHGIIQKPTRLPDLIYTNADNTGTQVWTRGPLASNEREAGKAWNEFRRALGSDHRDPTDSQLNKAMAAYAKTREQAQEDLELQTHDTETNSPLNKSIT